MPVLTVRHITTYRYRQPVAFGEHRMMFRPRDSYDQRLLDSALVITPEPVDMHWVHDVFGNCVAVRPIRRRARRNCASRAPSGWTIRPRTHSISAWRSTQETYPFTYSAEDMPDLLRSIERHAPDPRRDVDRWARRFLRREGATNTRELLAAMTHAIRQDFAYVRARGEGYAGPGPDLARWAAAAAATSPC